MMEAYITIFIIVNILVGVLASGKIKNFKEFALSRNHFGNVAIIATIVASFVGGGTVIGNIEKAFTIGISYLVPFTLGFSIQIIATGILFGSIINNKKNITSVGDIIRSAYGKNAQIITGIIWCIFATGITSISLVALSRVIIVLFPYLEGTALIIAAIAIILYSMLGGIRAVVATDIIQCFVMYICLPLILLIAIDYSGGISSTIDQVPHSYINPLSYLTITEIIIIFFSLLFGDALIPPVIQRLLMAKTPKQARNTMIISGFGIVLICSVAGGIGIVAFVINPNIKSIDVIPYLLNTVLTNNFLKYILIIGLIAAIMSTVDTYLNSLSVVFINDIVKVVWRIRDNSALFLARLATLFSGISSVIIASNCNDILDLLLDIFKLWGPTILVPLISALLFKVTSKYIFYICLFNALAINIIWVLFDLEADYGIDNLVPAICTNLTVCLVLKALIYFYTNMKGAYPEYFINKRRSESVIDVADNKK